MGGQFNTSFDPFLIILRVDHDPKFISSAPETATNNHALLPEKAVLSPDKVEKQEYYSTSPETVALQLEKQQQVVLCCVALIKRTS